MLTFKQACAAAGTGFSLASKARLFVMKAANSVTSGTDRNTGLAITGGLAPVRPDAFHDVLFRAVSYVHNNNKQGKAVVSLSAGK